MTISKKGIQATVIFGGFGLLGLVMIYIPVNASMQLLSAIQHHASHIDFQKGAYYLFGGGLIFFLFPIWILLLLIFKPDTTPEKTNKIQRIVVIFIGVCFVSIFVLPQVMSVSVGDYLEKRGYNYCDNQSSQWLFVRTMVYQKDSCQPNPK